MDPASLRNSTRIIFPNAQYDPIAATAVAPGDLPLTADPCASRALLTSDMAHREDLFARLPSDRDTTKRKRAAELEIIKGWLKYC